jgi:hypothetical protein
MKDLALSMPCAAVVICSAAGARAACPELANSYPSGAIGSAPDSPACNAIAEIHARHAKELATRAAVGAQFDHCVANIRNKLTIGMSENEIGAELACLPRGTLGASSTMTAAGKREQFPIYRDPDAPPIEYLYLENGHLTAIEITSR